MYSYDISLYVSMSLFSYFLFCFQQKTAYELRISDWSSDVCSSDLPADQRRLSGAECMYASCKRRRQAPRHGLAAWWRLLRRQWWRRLLREIGRAACRERVIQYV